MTAELAGRPSVEAIASDVIVHLSSGDGLVEAAARVQEAGGEGDIVVVAPANAPVLRNPIFLEALKQEVSGRALVLVTPDERARAMASGLRLAAFASLGARAVGVVDDTEHLERARRSVLATLAVRRVHAPIDRWRVAAVATAIACVAAFAWPSAEIVVAGTVLPVGPVELALRTAPAGAIPARELSAQIAAKAQGTASGSRTEVSKATGTIRLRNLRTDPVSVPAGTAVWTERNVRFRTTKAVTIPASSFAPFFFADVFAPLEAEQAGTAGNVARGTITRIGDKRVEATNLDPTSGGNERKIPIVTESDYAAASAKLDEALAVVAREQLVRWKQSPPDGMRVEEAVAASLLTRVPAAPEIVGREVATFDVNATGQARAYAVPSTEPRAAALRELAQRVHENYEVVDESVALQSKPAIADGGLTWQISASGSQRPRFDTWSLRLVLWAKDRQDAEALLAERGLRVVAMRASPDWWPRLPLVPLRIEVREASATAVRP
jgi:hypothetical protein